MEIQDFDSSGMWKMNESRKILEREGGRFVLATANKHLIRKFEITKMVIKDFIFQSLEDAVAGIKND